MNAECPRKPIKVPGHLEEQRGVYQMILNWHGENGARGRKSISTGLPLKGNKKKAEAMLGNARKSKEEELALTPTKAEETSNPLFADFMEHWLGAIKKDVSAFYENRLERVSARSVHRYHANISKTLKYALEKGLIQHSVMDRVKRPKAERFAGKFLKQSEVVDLFEAVKGHRLELGAILGAFYGLRREPIGFEANTITIEHTVTIATIDGKKTIIADDTTKSQANFRTLPLIPAFRGKLLAVKAEQEPNRKLCGRAYNNDDSRHIYTDPLGNRVKPDYLTDAFPKFMVKNGFRRVRFHDLRHSCASLPLASGVPLKQIQEWLGHSDFAITANTHAHLEFNFKLASAQAMTWIDKTSLGSN